jgi:TetR/AcrR family transcriptional regulator, cholesterol catabolism regulator
VADTAAPDGATDPAETDPAELSAEQLERRRRLIDAAFELGAEGGYDAVQMRDVAATANVALATIYRNFSSKDHLLAAAMTEWTGRLRDRVANRPPRGDTATEQMIDVLSRACGSMRRQPKLSMALVRALSSSDVGVRDSGSEVRRSIASMGDGILAHLEPEVRADILAVLGHVWYSSLVGWANGRSSFDVVISELARACRVLISPYDDLPRDRTDAEA